ncbi:MAG: hypothetical protein LBQ59_03695 [Candidatus Peribacteria bacterium]|jgi:hypothetical protein|nr:hypothetical protein [Candidatus Peribacteria bacterium]
MDNQIEVIIVTCIIFQAAQYADNTSDCVHKINHTLATIQISTVKDKLRATISTDDGNHNLKLFVKIFRSGM